MLDNPKLLKDQVQRYLPSDTNTLMVMGSNALVQVFHSCARCVVSHDDLAENQRVECIIAIEQLNQSQKPKEMISNLTGHLVNHGILILVERIYQNPTLRIIHKLLEPSRHFFPPEVITSLVLNAGYVDIRQFWPNTDIRTVVTVGKRLELPSAY